jgi:hypothetical protein
VSIAAEPRLRLGLGTVAAATGLLIGVALFVARNLGGEPKPPSAWLEEGVLALVVFAPLALAVAARTFEPVVRAGVWAGVGLLITFLGLLTLISPIGLVFLAIGALVFIGGLRARRGRVLAPRFLAPAAVVVAAGVLAPVAAFFLFSQSPACWERSTVTGAGWQRVEPRHRPGDVGYRSPGVIGTCSSDTVTTREAALATGVWLAAAAGLVVGNRRLGAA